MNPIHDAAELDHARARILIALDTDNADSALALVRTLAPHVGGFKVGLELANSVGFDIFEQIRASADSDATRLFYDAKFHDIPNTVAGAVRAATRRGVWMVNVHAGGGPEMLRAAATAAHESTTENHNRPLVIGVTVLTSLDNDLLRTTYNQPMNALDLVLHQARLCQESGLDGVVCSGGEVQQIRQLCGPDFITVVPGIRLAGDAPNDQKRVATPHDAIQNGATYLVLGRAVTHAPEPLRAAQQVANDIARAMKEQAGTT